MVENITGTLIPSKLSFSPYFFNPGWETESTNAVAFKTAT
jgi:hypothetical protein